MRLLEELRRRLPKLRGKAADELHSILIRLTAQQSALVRVPVKEVVRGEGRWSDLLAAEDEVNPEVQMCRHVVGFECGAHEANKLVGRAVRPGRQHDVIRRRDTQLIGQEGRLRVKLRYQLLHVTSGALGDIPSRLLHGDECA